MRFARLKLAALAVVAAISVAGCDSATGVVPLPDAGGGLGQSNSGGSATYTLATVNAAPLPFDVRNDAAGRVTILGGSLSLGSGTFAQALTLQEAPTGGAVTQRQSTTHGTFTVSGSRIVFRASDGGQWTGTISGSKVEYAVPANAGSLTFSFTRG